MILNRHDKNYRETLLLEGEEEIVAKKTEEIMRHGINKEIAKQLAEQFIQEQEKLASGYRTRIDELTEQSTTDPLTGVKNRKFFGERINQEFERIKRYGDTFSLLMIDIDFFKKVNDTLGHQAGDEALKKVTSIMEKTFRGTDVISRYGGEEFAVILPQTVNGKAIKGAERLREEIEKELKPFLIKKYGENAKNPEIAGTVSIGVISSSNIYNNVEEMIEEADKALYKAKKKGRNQVINANDEQQKRLEKVIGIINNPEIQEAIDNLTENMEAREKAEAEKIIQSLSEEKRGQAEKLGEIYPPEKMLKALRLLAG